MSAEDAIPFDEWPKKRCQIRFCPTIGPFTNKRLIWVGVPDDEVVGWCRICRKFICAHCAIRREMGQEEFWALDEDSEIRRLSQRVGEYPVSLQCRHCGEFFGEGDDILILINRDYVSGG